MSVVISGSTPYSITDIAPRSVTTVAGTDTAQATNPAPAATVEISSEARQAYSDGQDFPDDPGMRPLNIIWGNSPK